MRMWGFLIKYGGVLARFLSGITSLSQRRKTLTQASNLIQTFSSQQNPDPSHPPSNLWGRSVCFLYNNFYASKAWDANTIYKKFWIQTTVLLLSGMVLPDCTMNIDRSPTHVTDPPVGRNPSHRDQTPLAQSVRSWCKDEGTAAALNINDDGRNVLDHRYQLAACRGYRPHRFR